jgi:hypothetical protein
MFNIYPRKFGVPEQVTVFSEEHLLKLIEGANGHMNLYIAAFSDDQKIFGNLDKVFFDIDDCPADCKNCIPEKKSKCSTEALNCTPASYNSFDNMMILHEYFKEKRLQHVIGMSGGGYHIYTKVIPVQLRYANYALKKYCAEVVKECNIKADCSVFEIFRIMRIPGTYNVNKGKWFIWVYPEDLEKGDTWIREKANKQIIEPPYIYEKKSLDLRPYDRMCTNTHDNFQYAVDSALSADNMEYPPCISKMLNDKFMNFKKRFYVLLYLKEKGVSMASALGVLQKHLTPNKFIHCVKEERQPVYIWRNDKLFFPKCRTLEIEGFCPQPNCPLKDKIYL